MKLFEFLTQTIGIDPGSQNLRLATKDQITFNEPAELSIEPDNTLSGFGNKTIRTQHNKVIKPVNVAISDFHAFEMLLRKAIKQTQNKQTWFPASYRMYFTIPMSTTEVEKRAYRDAGEHAGAKEVYMMYQPCTAAIAMGILNTKKDFILVDFGASKIEITVFANSIPVADGAIRIGTWRLRHALRNHILRNHSISPSAEELEQLLRNMSELKGEQKIKNKSIDLSEFHEVLNPFFFIMKDQILETLEQVGTHRNIDRIISNGIYFTGGGSQLKWIIEKIFSDRRINFNISNHPFLDNINGVKQVMQEPDRFKDYLMW